MFYLLRAELQRAHEIVKQLVSLAEDAQDLAMLMETHEALGGALFYRGEFDPARAHLEKGITLYDPRKHRSWAFHNVTDPGVALLTYTAWTLWFLGYPDQALKRSQEALTLPQELNHPDSLAAALGWSALFHQYRREVQ